MRGRRAKEKVVWEREFGERRSRGVEIDGRWEVYWIGGAREGRKREGLGKEEGLKRGCRVEEYESG